MNKAKFNKKMSMQKMYPRHIRLKKGGMVRKKFDSGGIATNSTDAGMNQSGATNAVANTNNSNPIGNALGLNNGFQAGAANIQSGTSQGQLSNAYTGAQNAINAGVGLANTFVPQANQAVTEQNQLAQQYNNIINGTGPNAAQTQFATNTAQNVANQAALAAGQRGAANNVGLIEREAAQQGANTEQQAAGQAAQTQAAQQVAAQQNLANLATTQAGQATGAVTNLNQAQQNEQNILQGANTAYNNAAVGMQSNLNSTNAQTAAANQNMNANIIGSVGSALGSVIPGLAKGGMVQKFDNGGYAAVESAGTGGPNIAPVSPLPEFKFQNLAQIKDKKPSQQDPDLIPVTEQTLAGGPEQNDLEASPNEAPMNPFGNNNDQMIMAWKGGEMKGPHQSHVANFMFGGGMATGGKVPALVSPKEVYLSPDKVKAVVEQGADPMKIGEHIPGQDKVKGKDSKKNDFIPKDLEEGGVVVPIHISTHKKASEKSRKFVEHAVAKHMKSPKAGR